MNELKPCPFCGKTVAGFASAKEEEDCKFFEDSERCEAFVYNGCPCIKIVCNMQKGGCGASTGYCWSQADAIEKWNKRHSEITEDDRK